MNTHKHKCPSCGSVWEHPDSCMDNFEAHICKCGDVVTRICWEDDNNPAVNYDHPVQHCVPSLPRPGGDAFEALARLVLLSAIKDLVNEK